LIEIERPDRTIDAVCCHSVGYLGWSKVDARTGLGNLLIAGVELEEKHN
jgi:hypothetical protein